VIRFIILCLESTTSILFLCSSPPPPCVPLPLLPSVPFPSEAGVWVPPSYLNSHINLIFFFSRACAGEFPLACWSPNSSFSQGRLSGWYMILVHLNTSARPRVSSKSHGGSSLTQFESDSPSRCRPFALSPEEKPMSDYAAVPK